MAHATNCAVGTKEKLYAVIFQRFIVLVSLSRRFDKMFFIVPARRRFVPGLGNCGAATENELKDELRGTRKVVKIALRLASRRDGYFSFRS